MTKLLDDLAEVVRLLGDKYDYAHQARKAWDLIRTHAAEIERNARDAQRYRWLRDVAWSLPAISQQELPAVAVFSGSGRRCKDISGEEMDRAIDDAMKLEPTHD